MTPVNNFLRRRIERLIEVVSIAKAIDDYKLKESLSLDTFNANIRFQRQFLYDHWLSELSNVGESHKIYNKEDMTVTIMLDDERTITFSVIDNTVEPIINTITS